MKRSHSVRRVLQRVRATKRRALYGLGLMAALVLFALATFGASAPLISPEVHFADADPSGLQIIPASCPSSPDWPGQCDTPPLCPNGNPSPNGDVNQCSPPSGTPTFSVQQEGSQCSSDGLTASHSIYIPAHDSSGYYELGNGELYLNNAPYTSPDAGQTYTFNGLTPNTNYACADSEDYGSPGGQINQGPISATCSFTTPACSPPPGPELCPDGTPAPNNNAGQCTCTQDNPGNPGACSNPNPVLCPDGSAAPNNDTSQCTCTQDNPGNPGACSSGPSGCTGPSSCTPPPPPNPACVIAAAPTSASPGEPILIGWASACDSTTSSGCPINFSGFPLGEGFAGGIALSPNTGALSLPASTNGNPIEVTPSSLPVTYTLSGQLYAAPPFGFLSIPGTGYSCQVTIQSQQTPPRPQQCTVLSASCSADGTSIHYTTNPASCQPDVQCQYGCQTDSSGTPYCVVPSLPTVSLEVSPILVTPNTPVNVSWSESGGSEDVSCAVAGTNGDQWSGGDTGNERSQLIVGQTTYTLECYGTLDGAATPLQSATVNIVPVFQEK